MERLGFAASPQGQGPTFQHFWYLEGQLVYLIRGG